MIRLGYYCALHALIFIPTLGAATEVMRCKDANGHITYTLQGCIPGQSLELQNAHNPPPGSIPPSLKPMPESTSNGQRRTPIINVIGSKEPPCESTLSAEEKRRAIIRKQIRQGMTKAEVESSLGRPNRIIESNGQSRYLYQPATKRSRNGERSISVSFDEYGCTKGASPKRQRGKSGQ